MTIYLPRLLNSCEINVIKMFQEPLHRPYAFTIERIFMNSASHSREAPFVIQGSFTHCPSFKVPNLFKATHVLAKDFTVRPIPSHMRMPYDYKHSNGHEYYDHFKLPFVAKVGDVLMFVPMC